MGKFAASNWSMETADVLESSGLLCCFAVNLSNDDSSIGGCRIEQIEETV